VRCSQTDDNKSNQYRFTKQYSTSLAPDVPNLSNIPLHLKAQHQIGVSIKSEATRKQKRRIVYRAKCKTSLSAILASVIDKTKDYRPFGEVTLLGKTLSWLMDIGATINGIGGKIPRDLAVSNANVTSVQAKFRTADGSSQDIVGLIPTSICFRGGTEPMTFYIV